MVNGYHINIVNSNKKKLIVFRALPKIRDARTVRYLSTEGYEKVVLNTWEDEENERGWLHNLKLDRKKNMKIVAYPLYLLYLFLYSLFYIKNNDDLICMELDTFLPVYLGSFFKKNKIYFDIVDPISETKFRALSRIDFVFDFIEMFFLKYRHENIIPNHYRINYYAEKYNINLDNKCHYIVVENVPLLKTKTYLYESHEVITIGYFGTLEKTRGLLELVEFVKNSPFKLIIAGDGTLKNRLLSDIEDCNNIEYLGAFQYENIDFLYRKIDFLWAYYSPTVFLHKFASPNKYYEHLAFKKAIIMNKYVPQAKTIQEQKSGIVIDDILTEDTFIQLSKSLLKYQYNIKNFILWEKKYSNYKIRLK